MSHQESELEAVTKERDIVTAALESCIIAAMPICELAKELGLRLGDRCTHEGVDRLIAAYKAQRDKLRMAHKYLHAARDERGELRDAILEQAVEFLDSARVPTEEELNKPITVG